MRLNTILFGLGVLGLPVLASANILVNGDFENQPNWGNGVSGDFGYTANTGNQIPGWTIEAGHAITVHNTNWYPFISGSYSLNMDGEGYNGVNGEIYQDFASSNSQPYALEFDHLGWLSSTIGLQVSVVDTTTNAVLYNNISPWTGPLGHTAGNFIGTGNTLRLRINEAPESHVNDNAWIVDNFSVEPVPEPLTVCILGLGVAALLKRRRA